MVFSKAIATFQQVQVRNSSGFRSSTYKDDLRYFTWKGMKKHYAVIPLVVIMGAATVGLCGFIIYSFRTRTDIYLSRSKPCLSESMDMMNPKKTKIVVFNQEYKPMPELDAALKAREE